MSSGSVRSPEEMVPCHLQYVRDPINHVHVGALRTRCMGKEAKEARDQESAQTDLKDNA